MLFIDWYYKSTFLNLFLCNLGVYNYDGWMKTTPKHTHMHTGRNDDTPTHIYTGRNFTNL